MPAVKCHAAIRSLWLRIVKTDGKLGGGGSGKGMKGGAVMCASMLSPADAGCRDRKLQAASRELDPMTVGYMLAISREQLLCSHKRFSLRLAPLADVCTVTAPCTASSMQTHMRSAILAIAQMEKLACPRTYNAWQLVRREVMLPVALNSFLVSWHREASVAEEDL